MLASFKALKFIFRHLVPAPFRYPLARILASIVYACSPARRKVIIENLTPLIGIEKARDVAPRLFGNFAVTSVDFFCPRREMLKQVRIEHEGVLEKTWRKYRKVIFVTSHVGNWELGMSYLVSKGFSMAGLYAPYREDEVVEWIMSHRGPGVEWIPVARGAAEACLSALERGRLLGLLADIPYGEKGRRVRIGSAYARLPLGPWGIAVRARAAVIAGFILRTSPGHYRIEFGEPMIPIEGTFRKQMERLQEAYRTQLEKYLMEYPDQWGLLEPFWETK